MMTVRNQRTKQKRGTNSLEQRHKEGEGRLWYRRLGSTEEVFIRGRLRWKLAFGWGCNVYVSKLGVPGQILFRKSEFIFNHLVTSTTCRHGPSSEVTPSPWSPLTCLQGRLFHSEF